jgi:hypothetical protein
MPEPVQVVVSFTAPNTFSFNPDPVTVRESEDILFVRDPAQSGWTFVGFNVVGDPVDFHEMDAVEGEMLVSDLDRAQGTYDYFITIRTDLGEVIKSDPKVVNVPE